MPVLHPHMLKNFTSNGSLRYIEPNKVYLQLATHELRRLKGLLLIVD